LLLYTSNKHLFNTNIINHFRMFNIANLFHHESENIGNTATYTRMENEKFPDDF